MTSAEAIRPAALRRQQLIMLMGLMLLPFFVLAGVGTGFALGVRGTDVQVLALALTTGAVAIFPMTFDLGRPPVQRHVLLFFLLLSWIVFYVAPVFTSYFFADTFIGRKEFDFGELMAQRPTDIARGQFVVLVALLSLLAGYAVPIGRLVPGGIPRPRRDWSHQSTLVVAVITISLGWVIYLSSHYGILPRRAGSGFLGMIANSTYFGIALLMLCYLRHRSHAALLLMALLIPPTMAFNYFTSSKALFFGPIAVSMFAYIVVKRRIQLRWLLAAFVVFSLFYPIAEFQRQVILQGNTRSAAWALRKPLEVLSRTTSFVGGQEFGNLFLRGTVATILRFDGLGIVSVIVRDCPARVPFQGGWSLAQIPISYVPRIAWKNKPNLASGQWVTDNFGAGPEISSSTGATWTGELWFNFGWPGVLGGMLLMGVYLRFLHEMLFKPDAVTPAQLMAVIVLLAIPPALGGHLMGPVNGVVFGAMPILLSHFSVRLMSGTLRPTTAVDEKSTDLSSEARAEI